jgi:hypothetical protein
MTFLAAQYDSALGYTPQQDRLLIAAALPNGVVGTNDLLVTVASGFNSQIAGGSATILGTVQANAGSYFVTNIGAVTALHPTPDPTNSRLDTVFAKVFDSRDGGDASDIVQPVVVPGVPQAGNPNAGTLFTSRAGVGLVPTNSLWLADVYVPAAAASAASFSYADQRSTGQAWQTYMFSGSGGWTTTGTQPVMGDGVIWGKYQRNGKRVAVRIFLGFGAATTPGTGVWSFALPFGAARDGTQQSLSGWMDGNGSLYAATAVIQSGAATCQPWAGTLQLTNTTPTIWNAPGGTLVLEGIYECA